MSLSTSTLCVFVLVCVPALWMRFSGPDRAEQRGSRRAADRPHWFHPGSHDGRLHGRGSLRYMWLTCRARVTFGARNENYNSDYEKVDFKVSCPTEQY